MPSPPPSSSSRLNLIHQGFQPSRRRITPTAPRPPTSTHHPFQPRPMPTFRPSASTSRSPRSARDPVSPTWTPPLPPLSPFQHPPPLSPFHRAQPSHIRAYNSTSPRRPPPSRHNIPSPTSPFRTSIFDRTESPCRDLDNPQPHPLAQLSLAQETQETPLTPRRTPRPRRPRRRTRASAISTEPIDVDAPIDVEAPIDVDGMPTPPSSRARLNPERRHDVRPIPEWMLRERHAAAREKENSVWNALRPSAVESPAWNGYRIPAQQETDVRPRPPEHLLRGVSEGVRLVFEAGFAAGWNVATSGNPGDVTIPERFSQKPQEGRTAIASPSSKSQIERVQHTEKPLNLNKDRSSGVNAQKQACSAPAAPARPDASWTSVPSVREDTQLLSVGVPPQERVATHDQGPRSSATLERGVGAPAANIDAAHFASRPVTADDSAPVPQFRLSEQYTIAGNSDKSVSCDPSTLARHHPPPSRMEEAIPASTIPQAKQTGEAAHAARGKLRPMRVATSAINTAAKPDHILGSLATPPLGPSTHHREDTIPPSNQPQLKLTGEAAFAARGRKRPMSGLPSAFSSAVGSEPVQSRPSKQQKQTSAAAQNQMNLNGRMRGLPNNPSSRALSNFRDTASKITSENDRAGQTTAESEDLSFLERYGLLIVDRISDTMAIDWVMCKFCHVFGATGRQKGFLKMFGAPLKTKDFARHLSREHNEKWDEYQRVSPFEKKKFFAGHDLPAPEAIERRVKSLKTARKRQHAQRPIRGYSEIGDVTKQTAPQGTYVSAHRQGNSAILHNALGEMLPSKGARGAQMYNISPNICPSTIMPPMTDRERSHVPDMVGDYREAKSIFETPSVVDVEVAELILRGVLRICSQSELSDETRGFLVRESSVNDHEKRSFVLVLTEQTSRESEIASMLLFHLLRGVALSAAEQIVSVMHEISRNIDASVGNSKVVTMGNTICALGLSGLQRMVRHSACWAFSLSTRPCPLDDESIEFLVVFSGSHGSLHKLHLVSLRESEGTGEALLSMLDCICPDWITRLVGVSSGIPKDNVKRKGIENAIVDTLRTRAQNLSPFDYISSGTDAPKPIFPWVLSDMSDTEFESLIATKMPLLLKNFTERNVIDMKMEKTVLAVPKPTRPNNETESFREGWRATFGCAPLLEEFARILCTLWLQDRNDEEGFNFVTDPESDKNMQDSRRQNAGDLRSPASPVNAEAERILWARTVLQLRQIPCSGALSL